jgi:hypothetical protein
MPTCKRSLILGLTALASIITPLSWGQGSDSAHGRYQSHTDGTVTDTETGLMWKRCAEGQEWSDPSCEGEAVTPRWDAVMPKGQQRAWPPFAGHSDWRVPTREELRSLVWCSNGTSRETAWEKTCSGKGGWNIPSGDYQRPTIDTVAFPDTPTTWFWSASMGNSAAAGVWRVSFGAGNDFWGFRSVTGCVRLVRTGP